MESFEQIGYWAVQWKEVEGVLWRPEHTFQDAMKTFEMKGLTHKIKAIWRDKYGAGKGSYTIEDKNGRTNIATV